MEREICFDFGLVGVVGVHLAVYIICANMKVLSAVGGIKNKSPWRRCPCFKQDSFRSPFVCLATLLVWFVQLIAGLRVVLLQHLNYSAQVDLKFKFELKFEGEIKALI